MTPMRPALLLFFGLVTAALALSEPADARAKKPAPRWQQLPLPHAMPKPTDSGYVTSAGARIYYARFGKGDPVILLHGGMGNGGHWGNQVPALADTHQVIAIDSRGQGRSTRSADKPSYDQMALDVIAVMDHLKLATAAIVGWSDGGEIALKLAINHPTRVSRLVIFAANYDANGSKRRGPSSTFSAYSAKCRADYARLSKTPDEYDEATTWLLPIWKNPMGFTKDQLRGITAPTLIADGDHDEIIKLDQIQEMAQLIPHAQLVVFKDASHFAHWQDPTSFNKALVDFLTPSASP
jgi:pimeloyl-ACP methyl ester carboxylesterase